MMGWGWAPFHGVLSLLLLVLVIVGVGLLIRTAGRGGQAPPQPRPTALEILQERYARGELNREEYLQRKADIVVHRGER